MRQQSVNARNTNIVDARFTSHNINLATISASSATAMSAVPADTTKTPLNSGATRAAIIRPNRTT